MSHRVVGFKDYIMLIVDKYSELLPAANLFVRIIIYSKCIYTVYIYMYVYLYMYVYIYMGMQVAPRRQNCAPRDHGMCFIRYSLPKVSA